MVIVGRFAAVSDTDYRDGVVLVGFLGNVYPYDLSEENIDHIKGYYNMSGCKHRFYNEWPEFVKPRYPAAKKNFKNGFMLLEREGKHEKV